MSTLDGLLVGISTITANDVVLNLLKQKKGYKSDKERPMKIAMKASHIVLIVIAVAAFFIALNPPELLGIFGQVGVYGLVVAAVPPLLIGILYQRVNTQIVWVLSAIGLIIHLLLFFYGNNWFAECQLAFSNPAVPATFALSASCMPGLIYHHFLYKNDQNA
jgi:SSS family solute:Na+ symporter/sodium/pantothenate symporter